MLVQSCGAFLSYKATICDIGFAAQTKHFDQFLPDTISDAVVFNVTAVVCAYGLSLTTRAGRVTSGLKSAASTWRKSC
jgi:hypothetical protein